MSQVFPQASLDLLAAHYPEQPVRLAHGLRQHPLLTIDALAALAAKLPQATVEWNPGDLPIGIRVEDLPKGAQSLDSTLRNIETSGSWVLFKAIESDPAYKTLLEETLAEIRAAVAPVTGEMLTLRGFIFVSSPGSVTPLHLDPEHNILLQVQGRKVFTIFSQNDEEMLPPAIHELYHSGGHNRNLEWREEWAGRGTPIALGPGDALHVPVKAPHWVKVADEVSIALSITWQSAWTYCEADARGMNRILRKAGIDPAPPGRWPVRNVAKAYAYRALRRAGIAERL